MADCPKCGKLLPNESFKFCPHCGSQMDTPVQQAPPLGPGGSTAPGRRAGKKNIKLLAIALNVLIIGGVAYFVLGRGSCSSVEGEFVAAGQPLGNFKFIADSCRSGQRMNFFGVIMLGKGPNDGAIVPIHDVSQGKSVKVEVPGSCKPPDLEVCKEIDIKPEHCKVFELSVNRTSTRVNNITLLEGYLKLDCKFPEGGTAKADMKFSSCD